MVLTPPPVIFSLYGYSLMSANNFTHHRFAKESSLISNASRNGYASGLPLDLQDLELIGAVRATKRRRSRDGKDTEEKELEMLFLLALDGSKAQVCNLSNFGGMILGCSKVIFFNAAPPLPRMAVPQDAVENNAAAAVVAIIEAVFFILLLLQWVK